MSSIPWCEMTDAQKQRHLEHVQRWREGNREQENATRRVSYLQNRDHVLEQVRTYRDTREGQRKREAEASKRRYIRLKQEAITILGGKCCRCSCDDIRCLEIDHIIPVRGDRNVYGVKLYRSITQGNTENLQVLCANCHAIKTYEDGNGEV
jgi:5-methylcytosine-specific restriction endonuclease McrA